MMRDAPWRKLGGFFDDSDAFARVYNSGENRLSMMIRIFAP